jgi:G:T-mismatch repair DNA endonuclease (very short patch repair protein)
MDQGARTALKRRLEDVDQEIADLRSLLTILRTIERDERLRERLRNADLGFRLQDVWAGRLTGESLRDALAQLERLAAQPA